MKTLDGADVRFRVIGSKSRECKQKGADVLVSLMLKNEILENVFMDNAEATALAQKLLHIVAQNWEQERSNV